MNISNVVDIITAVVALAGLSLSVYNFFLRRIESKPRLDIQIEARSKKVKEKYEPVLLTKVTNIGEKSVLITDFSILFLSDRKQLRAALTNIRCEDGRELPLDVSPRQIVNFRGEMAPIRNIIKAISASNKDGTVIVKAGITDALSHKYYNRNRLVLHLRNYYQDQ